VCGICGVIHFDRKLNVERAVLEAMNKQILHRGPDDAGFYVSGNVGLAMRRLSIIDLQTGQQPISNEDGTVWIVYNGEVYNHSQLRSRLEARGHRYRTKSDTETIVHLYEEYGRDCVRHLRGMFAFLVWDERRRRFFAARDRLGIKPFYYRKDGQSFLFASEIKSLLAHTDVRAELNRDVLPEYLAFGYLSGEETLFAGIRKLLPGHTLELDESGALKIEPYWDVPSPDNAPTHFDRYYVETYRSMLEDAVASHLISDVPIGVFLSGGLDSSVVAALMSKLRGGPIETFSVGYEEAAFSELPYARTVAEHIGSVHHEVRVSSTEFFDVLPKLIWHEDEPLVWPSSVSLYFVARLAREHVTVVLTGEGSDETLAGYARYPWTVWNSRFDKLYRGLVPAQFRSWVRGVTARSPWLASALRRKLQHTFLGRDGNSWCSFYFDNFYSAFCASDQLDLLADKAGWTPEAPYRNSLRWWDKSSGDLIARLLYTDIKTYLVELCMKQDNMSMAASIESRVPFLDHRLVEFTTSIPSRFKTRGLAGKCILKTAARDLLPESIIHRRKMGFPTPLRGWLAGDRLGLVESTLLDSRSIARGLFRPEAIRRYFAEDRADKTDHSERIWRLLNLELWHRLFIDRDSELHLNLRCLSGKRTALWAGNEVYLAGDGQTPRNSCGSRS
jgi:asparagine synthase (glutamine-hydrolysing)